MIFLLSCRASLHQFYAFVECQSETLEFHFRRHFVIMFRLSSLISMILWLNSCRILSTWLGLLNRCVSKFNRYRQVDRTCAQKDRFFSSLLSHEWCHPKEMHHEYLNLTIVEIIIELTVHSFEDCCEGGKAVIKILTMTKIQKRQLISIGNFNYSNTISADLIFFTTIRFGVFVADIFLLLVFDRLIQWQYFGDKHQSTDFVSLFSSKIRFDWKEKNKLKRLRFSSVTKWPHRPKWSPKMFGCPYSLVLFKKQISSKSYRQWAIFYRLNGNFHSCEFPFFGKN